MRVGSTSSRASSQSMHLPTGTSVSKRLCRLWRRSVPPWPGRSTISTEMPRCRQARACMNHISSLMLSSPPKQISTGRRSPGKGARTK